MEFKADLENFRNLMLDEDLTTIYSCFSSDCGELVKELQNYFQRFDDGLI